MYRVTEGFGALETHLFIISCQCHNGDGPRLLPFLKTAPEGLVYKAVSYVYGSSECGRLPFKVKPSHVSGRAFSVLETR